MLAYSASPRRGTPAASGISSVHPGARGEGVQVATRGPCASRCAGGLWRRDGDKWVAEQVGLESMYDLLGLEQDTPWVLGQAVARGTASGPWQPVDVPSSLFFPDRRPAVTGADVDRAGDIWLDAEFTVVRRDKGAAGRYYRSVVTSRPVVKPLRARKAQRWQFPETVCGDPAALASADFKIVRELAVDLTSGKLSEAPPLAGP